MQLNQGYENSQPSILVKKPTLPAPFIPRPMQQSPWQATQTIQKAAQANKTSGKLPKVVAPVYRPPAPPKPAPKPVSVVQRPPVMPFNPIPIINPNVSAYQQIQNMANAKPIQNTQPVAKPISLAGATVKPQQSFLQKPLFGNVSLTHGSVPDYLAGALGSGLKKLAASLIPQFVQGQATSAQNPILTAYNTAGTNGAQNKGLDALKYLLGGIATLGEKAGNTFSNVDDGTGKKQDLQANGVLPSSGGGSSVPPPSNVPTDKTPFAPPTSPWQTLQAISGKSTGNEGNSMADFRQMQDTNNLPNEAVPPGTGGSPSDGSGGNADLNSVGMGNGSGGSNYAGGSGGDMGISSGADGSLSIGGSTFSVNDLMNLGLSADEVSALHSLADAQAKQQNDVQRQALDMSQAQADATYGNDQQTVNNQLADNAQQLDNSSFQDYLRSRQAIADRGLASSGLSDAANTQLLLAKQQSMAGLQRQADQALNQARTTHNNATADVTGKKALLNDATTSGTIYQNLYKNAMDAKQTNAKMALDLAMNQNNNSTKMGVAQLNNSTKMQIAQLDNQTKLTVNENNNATNLQKNAAALDMQQQTLNAQNWNNSQKQLIGMANQSYDQAKSLLSALAKDPKNKDLQNQYSIAVANGNSLRSQAVSAVNFNFSSGGSGGSIPTVKSTGSFNSDLAAANKRGVDPSWNNAIQWIVSKESGFNPNAKNKSSTAHGYAQFINSTMQAYDKKLGLNYNSSPVDQLIEMTAYLKDRYGTPQNAVNFWQKNQWY